MGITLPGQVARLAELFATGGWQDLRLESPDLSVHLSADSGSAPSGYNDAPAYASRPVPNVPPATVATPVAAPSTLADTQGSTDCAKVHAPNLGTFYRSPKPGAAPFVEIGQKVEAETEICLLEVMKLFTSVKAGVSGTIRKVCVEDGVLVEGDQVLFLIEAD